MIILGLESSCDETSIALLDNSDIIANNIYTQEVHAKYGGVVPEIASRAHIQKIDRLCLSILEETQYSPDDLDLLAVTDSPGLAGALLVGISFALGLHSSYKTPVIGVNHIEGHIASVMLENQDLTFPFLALVVSGGHTAIYRAEDFGDYTCLGQTIDDAAGEAFDKIGKLLGFPYPAGRDIEEQAALHTSGKTIPFPVARLSTPGIDFSFSGLKTAVKYFLEEHDEEYIEIHKPLICYSFQKAVIDSLTKNITKAVTLSGINRIALVGGVACNSSLRSALTETFNENVFFPSPLLCTDNAAMIAKAGYENYIRNKWRQPKMSPSGTL
jgi:N6-L-threonylcarbamoyladenine synthase